MAGMKDFADLKSLRDQLKEEERLRAIEQAARERRERIARERAVEFRGAMDGVTKMPESDRYVYRPVQEALLRATPEQRRLSQEEDDALVLQESLSDLFDVDGLLDDDPTLSYAREGVGPDVVKKLRKRHWPVQDELDLHGMTRDTARGQVGDFIRRSMRRGVRGLLRGESGRWRQRRADRPAQACPGPLNNSRSSKLTLLCVKMAPFLRSSCILILH